MIEPQSDILVIAGDISNDFLEANEFLTSVAPLYEKVIAIRGNHEFYRGFPIDVVENFAPENVVLLTYNRPFFFYKKTMFLGMTGWYDFNYPGVGSVEHQKEVARQSLADLQYVNFSYSDEETTSPEKLAKEHVSMLENQVRVANYAYLGQMNDAAQEIIIVTHTVPHIKGVVPPSHEFAYTNGSFYNSQMHMDGN